MSLHSFSIVVNIIRKRDGSNNGVFYCFRVPPSQIIDCLTVIKIRGSKSLSPHSEQKETLSPRNDPVCTPTYPYRSPCTTISLSLVRLLVSSFFIGQGQTQLMWIVPNPAERHHDFYSFGSFPMPVSRGALKITYIKRYEEQPIHPSIPVSYHPFLYTFILPYMQ